MNTLGIARLTWIIVINTSSGVLILRNVLLERQMYGLLKTSAPGRVYILPCIGLILLITGIVMELKHVKAAKYLNIGIFLIPTIYAVWLFMVSNGASAEARAYSLLLGLPCAFATLLTWLLYVRWRVERRNSPVD